MAALALEVEDSIDHVFEHPRAGDLSVLGDVANDEQGDAAPLGDPDQRLGGGAHLGDRARRRLERVDMHGLYRIDDQRPHGAGGVGRTVDRGDDIADGGRRGKGDRRAGKPQAARAQADLGLGLLAGHIDGAAAGAGDTGGRLKQESRFADARVAAHQRRSAGHEAAAEHPVELGNPRRQARGRRIGRREVGERERPSDAGAAGARRRGGLLDQGVPGAAGLAAARPFSVRGAAGLAHMRAARRACHRGRRRTVSMGPSARPWTNWSTNGSPLSSMAATGPLQTIRPA